MPTERLIGCLPTPCVTCPYREDVPSGVWAAEEYAKLPPYDRPTFQQPAALFMCHQGTGGLCTGWVQSHANREHEFDLLSLRMARDLDNAAVSKVALAEPLLKLFRTGTAAARHGLRKLRKPGREAVEAIGRIVRKRSRKAKEVARAD